MPLVKPQAARPSWGAAGLGEPLEAAGGGKGPVDGGSRFATSIFESYAAACGAGAYSSQGSDDDDAAFEEGMQRVEEHLLSTQGEAAACLICLENIGATEPIWHCAGGCFEMVHLFCIQQWARQQLAAAALKAEQQPRFPGAAPAKPPCWGCPKCRREYLSSAIPSGYRCFCGKAEDPPFDPWNAAHSCGERCERESPACGHPCMLLCHPGPCPPCPRIVHATCYCGAVSDEKRCGRHEFSCGGVCGGRLACGHSCPEVCHEGPCPPCGLVSLVRCCCGAEAAQLACSKQGVFQCGRVCGRALDCGRHTCQEICHAGPCGSCELAGVKSCPCGKQVVPGAPCDLVVPPCGSTCDKLLACGIHRCHERCHTGPCPQLCRGLVEKTCSCGKTTKVVQCHEPVRCERRCTLMRGCGRHQCKRRCCAGDCPPCEEVCGRRLKCGNHKCPAPCHAGACPPCPLAAHISCACSRTSYSVPCGRERLALPPPCKHACPVPLLCRHAANPATHRHPCHYGPCPGPAAAASGAPLCSLPCGTPHARCGHPCALPTCHDPLPPAIPAYQPPPPPSAPVGQDVGAGSSSSSSRKQRQAEAEPPPAVAEAARALAASLPRDERWFLSYCPPCQVPVAVTCRGGHKTVQVPCASAAPFSCGVPCGRALACGNHTCPLSCHDPGAEACQQCSLPCQKERCEHPCSLPCHPGDCPRCEASVTRACHCGKTSLRFACWEAAAGLAPERLRCEKTCHRALPYCPHLCNEACHSGPCPVGEICGEEVAVRCGCKRLKRKLPCREVQALLLAATGSRDYHAATPLRLLPCDAECAAAAAAASKAGKAAGRSGSEGELGVAGAVVALAGPAPEGALGKGAAGPAAAAAPGRKRSKAEERAAKEEERLRQRQLEERQARWKAVRQGTALGLALLLMLVVVLTAGLQIAKLMRRFDQTLQESYRPEL